MKTEKRFYVYTLAYPDELGGHIFYVGKGTGDRMLDHEVDARRDGRGRKCDVIRGIWTKGYRVQRSIVYATDIEEDALAYESACINTTFSSSWLTNTLTNTYAHELSDFEKELKYERERQAFLLAQSHGFRKVRKPIQYTDPCIDEDDD